MQIAIDGPAGVGKSSVAQDLARHLDILYLDTGAMYRAVTLACLEAGIPPDQSQAIQALLPTLDISFFANGQGIRLGDRDISPDIRSAQVSQAVSAYAALAEVRADLTRRQQALAQAHSVVMDGRDIGTVVLPHADFKFFLEASPQVRAQRRADQLRAQGQNPDLVQLGRDMEERDRKDRSRAHAPLKKAEDAIAIQTDTLTQEEVLAKILQSLE